jgi:hypothetical protein
VTKPAAAIRRWMIEQATALASVYRPVHLPSRARF